MLRFRVTISATGYLLVCLAMFISCSFLEEVEPKFTSENTGPYYLFKPYLNEVQTLLVDNDDRHLTQAFEQLLERVEEDWLDQEPYSVVDNWQFEKEFLSGTDRHDYVSLYSFVWPDPDSPGEFIIKDGQRNPDVDKYDRVPLANMSKAVEDLSLAYYLTGDSLYAKKTADFVKTWFLNEETHMNPHFEFTQITPGEDARRGLQGIVEARDFIPVIEAVSLIYESKYWTEEDHLKLKKWFHDFLRWIIRNYNADAFDNSIERNGRTYGSNIATWLDAQKTIYALFTEQEDLLNSRQILPLSESVKNRIDVNGSQPNELERGTPQHYTYFNMKGLVLQAEMRTRAGMNPADTWSAIGSESYSQRLKAGLDWLIPYAIGNKSLKDSQDFYKCRFIEFYRPAALALNEPRYEEVVETLILQDRYSCIDILTLLTHPPLERPGQMTLN